MDGRTDGPTDGWMDFLKTLYLPNYKVSRYEISFSQSYYSTPPFIHSFFPPSLPYGLSVPLPKPPLHRLPSGVSYFSLLYSVVYLISSSSCLRRLHLLPVTPVVPSIFPSITCVRRQFLHQLWPIQLVPLPFVLYVQCSFSPSVYAVPLYSFQLIISILPQSFPGIGLLFFDLSKFHSHTKLCSRRWISMVPYLNLIPICWWRQPSACWLLLLPWQSWSLSSVHKTHLEYHWFISNFSRFIINNITFSIVFRFSPCDTVLTNSVHHNYFVTHCKMFLV